MPRQNLVPGTEISVTPLNANFKELYDDMSTLSLASGSQATRIGTLETNYTTLNGNVNQLNNDVPNKAAKDFSNVDVSDLSSTFKNALTSSMLSYITTDIMPDWSAKVELTQNHDNTMQSAGWVLMHNVHGYPPYGGIGEVYGFINNVKVYGQVGAYGVYQDFCSLLALVDIGDVVRVNNPGSANGVYADFTFLFLPFKGGSNA